MARRHYSIDIETTGTDPVHTCIIQIGCVEFSLEEGDIKFDRVFDRCLMMPETRRWDEDTREWWMKQPKHVLDGIWYRMEKPEKVLKDFVEWMGYADENFIWAKPISFELPFFQSYFREFNIQIPWHYRNGMDVNTWIRAHGISDPTGYAKDIPFIGDVHDALADAIHQARTVLSCSKSSETLISDERS